MEDENKIQSNNEIDTGQEVDESILAQQPLMAALMNGAPVQPNTVEEPVNPVLASMPVEEANPAQPAQEVSPVDTQSVSNETVATDKAEEQPQDLSAYQPPSMEPDSEDKEELEKLKKKEKQEEKKKKIIKLIVSVLVVLALVVGGYFGYKKIFSGLNPFVKPIDNVADAVEYFENKLGIKLEQDDELASSQDNIVYRSNPENDSLRVYVSGAKDGQLYRVEYAADNTNMNKAIKLMMPFMKHYPDSSIADAGIKLARKYGDFNYGGLGDLLISKEDDFYAISIEFKTAEKKEKMVEFVNENKAIITKNISRMEINLKKKYGGSEFNRISAIGPIVFLQKGSISDNTGYVSVTFYVANSKLSLLKSIEEEKIIKSENASLGGKDGYLMVTKEVLGEKDYINWEFYIPSDGSKADIENSEEKNYCVISVTSSKDYLLTEELEKILKDAIKNVKLG